MALAGFCAGRSFNCTSENDKADESNQSSALGLCSVSRCFRKEAPNQEPTLYRVHQFTKKVYLIAVDEEQNPSHTQGVACMLSKKLEIHLLNGKLMDSGLSNHPSKEGRRCTDQITILRIIVEQSVDYEKAFYSMDRRTSWKRFRHYGVFEKMVNIIRHSYYGLTTLQIQHREHQSNHT
ncbi:unnamed protein product [Schistosoma mattheei]|uniref:Uncharacterized protein n=1 Tax=Schistosoma mattheei TaxID=31246 RepID=A0A183Q0Y6_9TREM|nr:unnamed protein product [Schistosoma mattheei]